MRAPRVDVFVDGFNLEFGAMRPFGVHWLDLRAMARRVLPGRFGEIASVSLYTAPLLDRPGRERVSTRHGLWLRACRSFAGIGVVLGHHVRQPRLLPRLSGEGREGPLVEVLQTIEKASDVNLAVDLVDRAHRGRLDGAAVISNDGDLARAVAVVSRDLGLPVIVVNPQRGRQSRSLAAAASAVRTLRRSDLVGSQLPERIESSGETIHRPPPWWAGA